MTDSNRREPSAEERYRALFDGSRDAIYLHDRQGRFLDANPAALDLLGFTRDEVPSVSFPDLLTSDDDLERAIRSTAELFTTGAQQTMSEYRLRRKDGRFVWVEVLGSLVRTPDGEPWAVQGVARDITERKRAEAELRSARNLLARTFASLSEAVFVIDPDDRTIVQCNPAAERIFGYAPGELIGRSTRILHVNDDSYGRFCTLTEPVLARHGTFSGEFEMKRKDGSLIPTEHTATVLFDELGSTSGVVSVIREITARRRAEAEMRLQSTALNAAANAIVITDSQGAIEWVNPAFTETSGYTAEEAIGRNPRDLLKSGLHDQVFYRKLWNTILAGNVWQGEMTNRHKDGHLIPEELTITPLKDDRGRIGHFIAIKRDLTEVKRLQAQVLQAQKLETVGRLAGGIAHDFNNLLTVINATADLTMGSTDAGNPLRADLQQIRDAGERAAQLTRQLLAFSRRQILQPDVLDLAALVRNLQAVLQRLIGEDVDLVVRAPQGSGNVRADLSQMEQVILNLAVNARDAMPDGGRLTIETAGVDLEEDDVIRHGAGSAGPHVVLTVSDTGVGMDDATRARIFEPFFTTKDPSKGTGLGLSTVYGIVQQSGGGVWVYSEPGLGATFKIYLPRLDTALSTAAPEPPRALGGSETILVVEDEPAVRRLAQRMLEMAGYTVFAAEDGGAALALLARADVHVDLLMTDVVLPGASGKALADEVATAYPSVRVLFTSGYTDDAILRTGVRDHEVAFLGKPYTASTLRQKVREILDS